MAEEATTCVDVLVHGIEKGAIPSSVFADDVVLDATVPNWRFTARGFPAVTRELAGWFADPARFRELRRTPLPDGELVEFTLTWVEHGVEHTCHQAHILQVHDGRIVSDIAFCGGRWPAALVAEMAGADV